MAVRTVVAEDHFLVREGLRRLLEEAEEIDLVAVCEDVDELRAAIAAHDLDVVVTDSSMPPTLTDEGIRLAAELRDTHPQLGVIVLSARCEVAHAAGLMASGFDGRAYLLKDQVHSAGQLVATIRSVARGGSVIDALVAESLIAEGRRAAAGSPLGALTPRERDVLAEMARGASNQAIADALGLTKRAVEKHVNAIFSKLALPDTPDLSRRVRAVLIFLSEAAPAAGA